jgi:hypothetical protein
MSDRSTFPRSSGRVAMLLLGLSLASGSAASAQVPAAPQNRPVALTGGTIHTVSDGIIPGGTIVFEGGRITAVGVGVPIPADAERVDITAGMSSRG